MRLHECRHYSRLMMVAVGALAGIAGSLIAYAARDPEHAAWLLLRTAGELGTYTQHGWLPARNFRFQDALVIGATLGAIVGTFLGGIAGTLKGRSREAAWVGGLAGFLGRMLIPLGNFVVE